MHLVLFGVVTIRLIPTLVFLDFNTRFVMTFTLLHLVYMTTQNVRVV